MKCLMTICGLVVFLQIWGGAAAFAGPFEDGTAYNRGDYFSGDPVNTAVRLNRGAAAYWMPRFRGA